MPKKTVNRENKKMRTVESVRTIYEQLSVVC